MAAQSVEVTRCPSPPPLRPQAIITMRPVGIRGKCPPWVIHAAFAMSASHPLFAQSLLFCCNARTVEKGHSGRIRDVRVRSALSPIAAELSHRSETTLRAETDIHPP